MASENNRFWFIFLRILPYTIKKEDTWHYVSSLVKTYIKFRLNNNNTKTKWVSAG